MADSPLFDRLKKMFSTDVIIRNTGGKKLKVIDTDDIQYATDRNSLRDRYNRLRSNTYNLHNRDMSMAYAAARLELFRDYDVMDMDPIIASALDIYADECLSGETIIPLLDGRKVTIGNLYQSAANNFWVYSLDKSGNFSPQLCERVAYNGKKAMVRITLCDGTEVKCTKNHIWVLNDGSHVTADNLKPGSTLKAFQTTLSTNKFMTGYEMLLENGKWEYTHRLVANRFEPLIADKRNLRSDYKIIHHETFDKRNNSPVELRWMDATEHYRLHATRNIEMWSDPAAANEYKKKIREAHAIYWTDERKRKVGERQTAFMLEYTGSMSSNERNLKYGLIGRKNGMFGRGSKLQAEKNGRWKNFSQVVDIEKYETDVIAGMSDLALRLKYNISNPLQSEIEAQLRNKWDVTQIKQLPIKKRHIDYISRGVTVGAIKNACAKLLDSGVNVYRKHNLVAAMIGITPVELKDFIQTCQYRGLRDMVEATNHRVISIEDCGEHDAYDLVNVGAEHVYAIEANDGSKIFTHNCLVPSEFGKVITINSTDENIKKILENLFYDILNVEFNLWSWTRNMVKYGDFFLNLEISPEYGVYVVRPITPYVITRVEGSDPKNVNYVKYQVDGSGGGQEFENFEIAHFRLISDSNFLPYGKSMIEGARRIWKQLSLMEDAMLIHRIMRAPEKRIFKLDIGNIPPSEVDGYMEKIMNKTKKIPYIDPQTGDYNLRFNLNNMVEDFFLPVRGGDSGTSIDTLPGMEFTGIEDIEYLRNKMMAALKIPKAFLGYEEGLSGKATLAAEDVRFSRTIGRLQRIIVSELTKIAIVHLYVQGYKDASLVDFELSLSNPSTIFEQEKIQIWQDKVNLAKDMMESNSFSRKWLYEKLWNVSEDDAAEMQKEIIADKKTEWRIAQIAEDGNDPASSGQKIDGEGSPVDMPSGGADAGPDKGPDDGPGGDIPDLPELKEEDDKKERDQTGLKDASDYPRGEDPLGKLANKERHHRRPIHTSAMSLEEELKTIKNALKRKYSTDRKSVITETKSMLDESNLDEDGKTP